MTRSITESDYARLTAYAKGQGYHLEDTPRTAPYELSRWRGPMGDRLIIFWRRENGQITMNYEASMLLKEMRLEQERNA